MSLRQIQLATVKIIIKPIVRFCVRNSHSIQDFYNMAKVVFLECAEEEIRKSSQKVNVSRLSVLTGLHRKDVTRFYQEKEAPREEPASLYSKVLGQWRHHKRFTTRSGAPRVLTFGGDKSEFRDLVESVSGNINPGTVLFEFKRSGIVKETKHGLALNLQLFSVQKDPRAGYSLLSMDVDTLINAVEQNLKGDLPISNLHIRTEYDSIAPSDIPEIRSWLVKEGKLMHKKVRNYLSRFDSDTNPKKRAKLEQSNEKGRVTFTSFSLTSTEPKKS